MTTAKDEIPVQEPLFLLPPPAPKPERKKLAGWHIAVLAVGVPIIVALTCIGANTVAHWWIGNPPMAHASAKASHTATPKPTPSYDLAGYRAAITGPAKLAFASALDAMLNDLSHLDTSAAGVDAPRLTGAAHTWLTALRATNPPPGYRSGKLANMRAESLGRRAASAVHSGLTTSNIGLLQRGYDLASRASEALNHASATEPHGS
jgi:hypothetical protein